MDALRQVTKGHHYQGETMYRLQDTVQDTVYFIISFLRNLNVVYNASLVIIKHNLKQRFITQHQKTTCLK